MTILERITQLREERGWSEYRLSEESAIPQSTISSWFRKNINPTISSLESICNAFNITLSQFFDFNNEAVTLTATQKDLLSQWSRLNTKQQQLFLDLLKAL